MNETKNFLMVVDKETKFKWFVTAIMKQLAIALEIPYDLIKLNYEKENKNKL